LNQHRGIAGGKVTIVRLDETYAKREIHDHWESIYRGTPLLDKLNDLIMDRIIDSIQPAPGAKFLDAGCGIGDHTARIARKGYECVGIDISPTILQKAEERIRSLGMSSRVRFVCQGLEDMSPDGDSFDVVHCRGVLMHIPDWKAALRSLCGALKPGGHIVILENNVKAFYSRAYLFARSLCKYREASRLVETEGGTELWKDENGSPFVVRLANINALNEALRGFKVEPVYRFSTSLIGIEQIPAGWLRNTVISLNHLVCILRIPPAICKGNVLIGKKSPCG
jgi:2-polyprenyl-3-methyl-5-hydroxy-6-metoxy-1,4-benzoquinol methylase